LLDYAVLLECLAGPDGVPAPLFPMSVQECLDAFDLDNDGDVDIEDVSGFCNWFTGAPAE
jgi:hypothetical protein